MNINRVYLEQQQAQQQPSHRQLQKFQNQNHNSQNRLSPSTNHNHNHNHNNKQLISQQEQESIEQQQQYQHSTDNILSQQNNILCKQYILYGLCLVFVFVLIGLVVSYMMLDISVVKNEIQLKVKDTNQNLNNLINDQYNASKKLQEIQQIQQPINQQKIQNIVQKQSQYKQPLQKQSIQIKQINPKQINNNFAQQNKSPKKQQRFKLFKHNEILNPKIADQLNLLLKDTFYDAHYFITQDQDCQHQDPLVLHLADQQQIQNSQQRQLLTITKTQQQLQKIIQQMKYNSDRPKKFPSISAVTRVAPSSIDLAYFFHALNFDPYNNDYIQAQYYRYNKLYNIGKYQNQLPLCITLVGKNTLKYQNKLYLTLQRQNYTNYRIVHIDDNSSDGTQQAIMQMIKQKPQFGKKITFVTQQIRRNQIYNRNMAIRDYCQQDAIILDMDADDWIIGNQVFQLVNSLYQSGHIYKGNHYDLWSLYFGHILYQPHCPCILPNIDGQIPQKQFTQHTYRNSGKWRTTHLRTFLRKIYLKIDINDFIDKQSPKNDYYYAEAPDAFMHSAILQLSGPKHLKVLDQFLYYYTATLANMRRRDSSLDIHYSAYTSKALTPYQTLQSLNDPVKRIQNYVLPEYVRSDKQVKTKEIKKRRDKILYQIQQMIFRSSYNI